ILLFFFPILFGTLFLTLYNTVDAIIVGQFLGKEALAAVSGGTSTLTNLIIGFFTGVASGATVVISQFYGAEDKDKVKKSLHTAIGIAIVFGAFITVVGYLLTNPMLSLMKTPEEIFPLASTYLHIYFGGALGLVLFNMASGILRAFGDSRHPLWFLMFGACLNIVLDILFIALFRRGVRGAAEATIISQALAAAATLLFLMKSKDEKKMEVKSMLSMDPFILRKMLAIGLPGGIQSVMYNISNMIIQTNVNLFGTDTAAAWASYNKLDAVFWMIVNAFGISITTFVGQNYGAGKIRRAKKGVLECLLMTFLTSLLLAVLYLRAGRYGFMLFTSDENVIEIGMRILSTIAPVFVVYVPIEVFSGALRGAGKTLVPTLFTVFGICGVRIIWLSLPWTKVSIERVMLSYAISWTLVTLLFVFYYFFSDVYGERSQKSSL
ncbi:MAG: MATE family efflux transporter, partial [Candidatus Ornithospirochaeta sp.]